MFLLGRKVGMTQVVGVDGRALPVTLVQAGPCRVLRVKEVATDGYDAVQLAFEDKPRRLATRAERGQVTVLDSGAGGAPKAGGEPPRVVREGKVAGGLKVGDVINAGVFEGKKFVDVVGVSKGRGFTGVMKRHNFSGLGAAHGVKKVHRSGGSVGQNTFPGRVFKGAKMAGHYGASRVTVRNLDLISVDVEKNLLVIRGAVPGPSGGLLVVRFPKEPPRSSL
ncbi:MAG: 50S ribosomal protein L3 [Planctomycetia bacterium]|nr:50S ribosomal protein L3 [Planctomycetia bacterium]